MQNMLLISNVHLMFFSFGIWKIQATYTEIFETVATAEFEVKEYGKSNDLIPFPNEY